MGQQYSRHDIHRAAGAIAIAAGVALLSACGGGSSDGSGSGSLTVGVTDAPVDDAEHVYVQFSSITLKPSGVDDDEDGDDDNVNDNGNNGDGPPFETITFDEPRRIDLLDQQHGNSALLIEDEPVPAGDYDWIRLGVDLGQGDSVIVIDGGENDLRIPSGAQTGLKLVTPFTVANGGTLDLTIDFDLRKSVVETGNGEYILKPALRLVRTEETGEIAVNASETYVSNNQCGSEPGKNAVYVFEGDVVPDDVDGNEPDPITTVLDSDDSDGKFTGTAGFLEPGTYTVTYVCDAEDDDPSADEDDNGGLTFLDIDDAVEVEAGETAEYNLPE
ncbi:DUF4382 domain-containing protein [Halofilum ochraceum]|uniref:DUF4382 domain-containing protein n=1 Tax=Halofilum ochraceum TaxID=1611323 RepID=UPI00083703A3|nr:DUF4382 domain-containing protein [Halofilum ochraceum]